MVDHINYCLFQLKMVGAALAGNPTLYERADEEEDDQELDPELVNHALSHVSLGDIPLSRALLRRAEIAVQRLGSATYYPHEIKVYIDF